MNPLPTFPNRHNLVRVMKSLLILTVAMLMFAPPPRRRDDILL